MTISARQVRVRQPVRDRRLSRARRGATRRAVVVVLAAAASAGVLAGGVLALSRPGAVGWPGAAGRLSATDGTRSATSVTEHLSARMVNVAEMSGPRGTGITLTPSVTKTSAAKTSAAKATGKLTLTAAQRHACPSFATACVDLAAHVTWLQSGGEVTFGPVRMEPGYGHQGTPHATPEGTFRVQWKAGPGFVSNLYGDPMPWATFFAAGGIAFHGGSLTQPSHGCVHLTVPDAKYFHDHLPLGAKVVVFSM